MTQTEKAVIKRVKDRERKNKKGKEKKNAYKKSRVSVPLSLGISVSLLG
jgi:hypothetical protein